MTDATAPHWHVSRRAVRNAIVVLLLLLAVTIVLQKLAGANVFSQLDEASGDWAYVTVFLLVFADAICPVFPGETTLNAASTLAAQGVLTLGLVMIAGALGAVIGDSSLYWIARRFGKRFQSRVEAARQNPKVGAALQFLGDRTPVLLVAGRYVPGVRFAVNASLGLAEYPYPSFLLWSSIGGTLWSVYTCWLAYLVATSLANFPLASVVISGLITTTALAIIYVVVRRSRTNAAQAAPVQEAPPSPLNP
jgi:membrane protein DedA with SNARE-associated domain